MRMNKNKVLALALAICLLAVGSMSSLAWFTDSDSVTNDFLIAGSEDQDPDKVFSVDVWEKDADGVRYDDGIQFPAIEPGDDLYKEVNIENTGAYDQYIRAVVTVTDANIWQEIFGEEHFALTELVTDLNPNFNVWAVICDEASDSMIYVLHYNAILPFQTDDVVNLFTNVHIPEAMDRYQAAEMQNFQMNIVAYAAQTQNVGANADEAFETVGMAIEGGEYCLTKDVTLQRDNASSRVSHNAIFENVTFDSTGACFQNMGVDVQMFDVNMSTSSSGDYANIIHGGVTVFNNVNIDAAGGTVGVTGGKAIFNSGSAVISGTTTNPRYNFYVDGQGTELEINGGEFNFTSKTLKRAYIYSAAGTTVTINGGTFGTASTRNGYTAGILGDGTVIIKGGTFGFDPTQWVADG